MRLIKFILMHLTIQLTKQYQDYDEQELKFYFKPNSDNNKTSMETILRLLETLVYNQSKNELNIVQLPGNTVTSKPYDVSGAKMYVWSVMSIYAIIVILLLIYRLKPYTLNVSDYENERTDAEKLLRYIEEQTIKRDILEKLGDEEYRKKLWNIYNSDGNIIKVNEEEHNAREEAVVKNLQKKIEDLEIKTKKSTDIIDNKRVSEISKLKDWAKNFESNIMSKFESTSSSSKTQQMSTSATGSNKKRSYHHSFRISKNKDSANLDIKNNNSNRAHSDSSNLYTQSVDIHQEDDDQVFFTVSSISSKQNRDSTKAKLSDDVLFKRAKSSSRPILKCSSYSKPPSIIIDSDSTTSPSSSCQFSPCTTKNSPHFLDVPKPRTTSETLKNVIYTLNRQKSIDKSTKSVTFDTQENET